MCSFSEFLFKRKYKGVLKRRLFFRVLIFYDV